MWWPERRLLHTRGPVSVGRTDNITSVRNDPRALRDAVRDAQTWVMSLPLHRHLRLVHRLQLRLRSGTAEQFGRTLLQAASVVFIGPLVGSLIRPVGGWLADRYGSAKVTVWTFAGMALATAVVIMASQLRSLPLFVSIFLALFVLSGIGNGSTYKMIPSIFDVKARAAIAAGEPSQSALMTARRLSGAVIGIAGAIGAMGGVFINLAFRQSFLTTHSGVPACWFFLGFMRCACW